MYQIEQQVVEQNLIFEKIRQYVAGDGLKGQIHQVEENLFRMLPELGLSLLKEIIARHGTGKEKQTITNKDGREIPYHGIKTREYLSIFGELEIARAHYWSKGMKGMCPPDSLLNLPERKYSYLLSKWVEAGIAEKPYDEAIAGIGDLPGLRIRKHGQEDMVRSMSRNVEGYYREKPAFDESSEGAVLCAAVDCTGVVVVPSERPSEAKNRAGDDKAGETEKTGRRRAATVTSDFSFKPGKRTPKEMIGLLMKEHKKEKEAGAGKPNPRSPLNKQVFATMTGKADAVKLLADRIAGRDPEAKKPIYVQLDGDPVLQCAVPDEFESRGWSEWVCGLCPDIMHATDYVWDAGTALFGEKSQARKGWVRKQGLTIPEGNVGRVIGSLRQTITKRGDKLGESQTKALRKTLTYLRNHRHMTDYAYYLRKGYPIATGVIEGTCGSLVKDRTDGSAMQRTRAGAQAVLSLRALKRNEDRNLYWDYHIKNEQQRLYALAA